MADEIETMADWNAVIAMCCPCMVQPVPPEPDLVADTISIDVENCGTGVVLPSFEPLLWQPIPCVAGQTRFKKLVLTYSEARSDQGSISGQSEIRYFRNDNNYCTFEVTETNEGDIDPGTAGVLFDPPQYTQDGGSGGYFFNYKQTGTVGDPVTATYSTSQRWEYSEPVTNPLGEMERDADGLISKAFADRNFWCNGLSRGGSIHAETKVITATDCQTIRPPKPTHIRRSKSFYQWLILKSWEGNTFKITWDVIFASQEWLAWKSTPEPRAAMPAAPIFVEKGKTVTWRGPGTGEQDDPSWIAGDRFVLNPPAQPGQHLIVNIRFEGTPNNPWGTKPQIMGVGYDPANP